MRKPTKLASLLALLTVTGLFLGYVHAYPLPGPGQEVYVTYYSNAAKTSQVGVRAISHDSACGTWHITWGTTSAYSTVSVTNCPGF